MRKLSIGAEVFESVWLIFFFTFIRSIIRHKVRILLRLALHYANCSPQIRNKISSIARKFKRIGLLYFKLMKDGADIFTTDSALISVWYQFTVNFPEIISSILESVKN